MFVQTILNNTLCCQHRCCYISFPVLSTQEVELIRDQFNYLLTLIDVSVEGCKQFWFNRLHPSMKHKETQSPWVHWSLLTLKCCCCNSINFSPKCSKQRCRHFSFCILSIYPLFWYIIYTHPSCTACTHLHPAQDGGMKQLIWSNLCHQHRKLIWSVQPPININWWSLNSFTPPLWWGLEKSLSLPLILPSPWY